MDGDVETLRVEARRECQAGDAAPNDGDGFQGPMLCLRAEMPRLPGPDGGSPRSAAGGC
jgi:hypothetical protein